MKPLLHNIAIVTMTVLILFGIHIYELDAKLPPTVIDFEHFSTKDGLANPVVYDIVQDRHGFLWFATGNGVSRYDGYHFTNYLPEKENPYTIGGATAIRLYLDSRDRLWITTIDQGLYRYDEESRHFIRYRHDPENPNSLSSNAVYGLIEDQQGIFWITTVNAGLNRYDEANNDFTHYRHDPENPDSLSTDMLQAILEDRQGELWIGTQGGGLNRYDRRHDRFIRYQHNPDEPGSLPSGTFGWIYEDGTGILWLSAVGNGLVRYHRDTDTFTAYRHDPENPYSISHSNVIKILEDRQGTLWITTWGGGLNVYNRKHDRFLRYTHDPNQSTSLSHNGTWGLYEDRSGVLWVGTYGAGVNKYDRKTERFARLRHQPANTNSLSYNDVKALYEDQQGDVWIGTLGGGLNKYDPRTERFIRYRHDPENPESISSNHIWTIAEDQTHDLWIATDNGLNRYDRDQNRFIHYRHDPENPSSLREDVIRSLHIDQNNTLWVANQYTGVDRYEREHDAFIHYPIKGMHNSTLYEDRTGTLWSGNAQGLFRYDQSLDAFVNVRRDPDDPNSAIQDFITVISEDADGHVWIGTTTGLNKYDRQTGMFERYTTKDGLIDDAISGILANETGILWVSTSKGLSAFHIKERTFRNYDIGTFNRGAALTRQNGELLFGGTHGVTRFFPEDIIDNPHVPPIVLTSFRKFNQEVPFNRSGSHPSALRLSYKDRFFSFEFAALDFSRPDKNQYQYKLEGFDTDWVEVGSDRRIATYTNLDGGEYVFRVCGSNNDGIWNEEGVVLPIHIAPPFWETWWFRWGMAVLVIAGIIGGFRWRVSAIETHRRQLERQVAERTQALQEAKNVAEKAKEKALEAKNEAEMANRAKSEFLSKMSHELRTPLNSILGYAQILRRDGDVSLWQADGLGIIQQSGEHLLTLINDILDLAKIEAGKLELFPTEFHLPNFLRGIAGIIRMRADQKDLAFAYEPLSPIPIGVQADETRLRQVLLNLLGNAVKFTDEGHVLLNVSTIEELESDVGTPYVKLRFEVTDTGVGISPKQVEHIFQPFEQVGDVAHRAEGTGLGLAISRQFVQAMGGCLHAKSQLGEGSTFWFDIIVPSVTIAPKINVTPERKIVGYTGPRRKALIVDDKEYNRLVLVNLLEPLGFDIVTALDGREEVDKACHIRPDVILTDLIMPVMTGIEAIQEIRKIPELQHVSIIAVSASVFDMDQQQSKLAECDGFLPKPVNAEKLLELLATHLKLEWIYENMDEQTDKISNLKSQISNIMPPSPEELRNLFEIARRGNMRKIRERATHIEQMNEKYKPFTDILQQLARGYEEKEIRALLQCYIGEDQ